MTVRWRKKSRKKAGHRSWQAGNGRIAGAHRGDTMSPETRSSVMSQIKCTNTTPERLIFSELRRRRVYFAKHVAGLPGRPDVVFRRARMAVFIDGDFWHGWRFPLWQHKLTPEWRDKIAATRRRDQRNFRALRRNKWKVVRVWEHQIECDVEVCVDRVLAIREEQLATRSTQV